MGVRVWSLAEKLPGGRLASSLSSQGSAQRRRSAKLWKNVMLGLDQIWLLASPFPLSCWPSLLGQPLLLDCWCLGQAGALALLPNLPMSLSWHCPRGGMAVVDLPLMALPGCYMVLPFSLNSPGFRRYMK